jgi:rifampicin phosphotransferase
MRDLTANAAFRAPEGWVVALADAPAGSRNEIGGKAANLARMIRSGLPVPPGFCITAAAFQHWIGTCSAAGPLLDHLEVCRDGASDELRRTAATLRQALATAPLPVSMGRAIVAESERSGSGMSWAVRSSATTEDLALASAAGQHDTLLQVRGREALLDAVRECWRSLFSDRAVFYRRKHRIPHRSAAMAVVVQDMVPAGISGVVFTADPVTGGGERLVVEYVAGSGDALLQGRVRPGRVVVERGSGRVVETALGDSGLELPRSTLDPLLTLARRAEALFGGPQDIEWVESEGRVHLLQSRPITTLRVAAAAEGTWVWSNMNVAENLPRVATPMTWSFLDTCFRRIGDQLFRGFGIDPERQPPLRLVAGRVYMNVTSVRQILSAFAVSKTAPSAWLLGGYQDGALNADPRQWPAGDAMLGDHPCGRLHPWLLLRLVCRRSTWRGRRRYLKHLARTLNRFTELDYRGLSDAELAAHFRALVDYGLLRLRVPLMLGPGLAFGLALRRFTSKWLGDANGTLSAQLISCAGGMASAEAPLDLWRLAVWVSGQAPLHQAILETSQFSGLRDRLGRSAEGRRFLDRWDAFMRRYGHRTSGEVDIAIPRWFERPDDVLDRLRHYLRNTQEVDPVRLLEERSRQRERVVAACRARLRHPLRRWAFGFLVRQAQEGLVFRENLKHELVRAVAHLRWLLLEMGQRLTRSGALEQATDIFFLRLEELEPVWTGPANFDVRAVVKTRQEEHRANEALSPPPVVVGSFDPARHRLPPLDPRATVLSGLAVSAGVVVGMARVILQADAGESVLPGEILVAPHTDPGWTPHFLTAGGLVTDLGGQLSHGSVIAREYGLPAVVNVASATRLIRTGQRICVDGDRGQVVILD